MRNKLSISMRLLLGGAFGMAIALVGLTASASAATPFCASFGSGLCLSNHGNTGNNAQIWTENRNPGPNQDITLNQNMSACGGTGVVEGAPQNCPFTNHFNDTAFAGLAIDTINMSDTSGCIISGTGATTLGDVIMNSCTAAGSSWVAVPNTSGGNSGRQLLNVWYSNHTGNNYYLDSFGMVGGEAGLASFDDQNPSNWAH